MTVETQPPRPPRRAKNSPTRVRVSKPPEARRQEIIETALALFAEKGYEDTTLQDIAGRMQVSPGLCYKYFRSKEEIFEAAADRYAARAAEQLYLPGGEALPAPAALTHFLDRLFEYVWRHKEFEAHYPGSGSLRAARLDQTARHMVQLLCPVVEQGMREGAFHFEDAAAATRFLVFGTIHAFHEGLEGADVEEYLPCFRTASGRAIAAVLGYGQPL